MDWNWISGILLEENISFGHTDQKMNQVKVKPDIYDVYINMSIIT